MSIKVEYDSNSMVMTVTLDREKASNSLSIAMINEMIELFRVIRRRFQTAVMNEADNADASTSASSNNSTGSNNRTLERAAVVVNPKAAAEFNERFGECVVRVLVITGAGNKVFCSGMDLRAANESVSQTASTSDLFLEFFDSLKSLPMATVCMVNGPALGGGTCFLFVCDFVFIKSDAYIQFSEVKIGFLPALISCYIVPRAGGNVASYMLSGRRWSASELAHASLATAVDAADAVALRTVVDRFINEHLLTSSTRSVAAIKRLIAHVSTHSHDDNKRAATAAFRSGISSSDMLYGLSCFKEKTIPNWSLHLKSNL